MDIMETLSAHVRTIDGVNCHVGEVVPQEENYPFIFVQRSGEVVSDDLCHPVTIDYVSVDLECVSDDIEQSRQLAAKVKRGLNETALHSLSFENESGANQTIHGIDADDQDDTYIPRTIGADEALFVGALEVTMILGD